MVDPLNFQSVQVTLFTVPRQQIDIPLHKLTALIDQQPDNGALVAQILNKEWQKRFNALDLDRDFTLKKEQKEYLSLGSVTSLPPVIYWSANSVSQTLDSTRLKVTIASVLQIDTSIKHLQLSLSCREAESAANSSSPANIFSGFEGQLGAIGAFLNSTLNREEWQAFLLHCLAQGFQRLIINGYEDQDPFEIVFDKDSLPQISLQSAQVILVIDRLRITEEKFERARLAVETVEKLGADLSKLIDRTVVGNKKIFNPVRVGLPLTNAKAEITQLDGTKSDLQGKPDTGFNISDQQIETESGASLLALVSDQKFLASVASNGTVTRAQNFLCLRLKQLKQLGLDHYQLNTELINLSADEQRQLGLAGRIVPLLDGCLYVFEHPTEGLHPYDQARTEELLHSLLPNSTVAVITRDAYVPLIASNYPLKKPLNYEDLISCFAARPDNIPVPPDFKSIICISGRMGTGKSTQVFSTLPTIALGNGWRTVLAAGLPSRGLVGAYLDLFLEVRKFYAQLPLGRYKGLTIDEVYGSDLETFCSRFAHLRKVIALAPHMANWQLQQVKLNDRIDSLSIGDRVRLTLLLEATKPVPHTLYLCESPFRDVNPNRYSEIARGMRILAAKSNLVIFIDSRPRIGDQFADASHELTHPVLG